MAAPKTRNGSERAARLDVVSRMYLQRFRLVDIAAECGVTFQQISYDLKKVRKQWIESAVRDFDAARSQELAKLDALEDSHWIAWRKSIEPTTVTTKSKETYRERIEKTKVSTRDEEPNGDPRFLTGVHKCIEKRCQLLGLDAPVKREITGPGAVVQVITSTMNPQEAAEAYAATLNDE